MRTRALIAAALSSLLVLLAPPLEVAGAQPCPPGQPPGRPPGQPPGEDSSGRPESYGPGTCELLLSRSVGTAGTGFRVTGSGFRSGSEVTITFESDPVVLATVVAGASGGFTVGVAVPDGAEPGRHTVRASGVGPDGEPRSQTAGFTVVGDDGAGGRSAGTHAGEGSGSDRASTGSSGDSTAARGDDGGPLALAALSERGAADAGDDTSAGGADAGDAGDELAHAGHDSASDDGSGSDGSGLLTGLGLGAVVVATLAGIAVSRRRRHAAS